MLVDLVQATTRDDLRLDGAFQSPDSAGSSLNVDALCFVHGTGSNFYGSTLFDAFAERFLGLGVAVLRVNTRGHDGISTAATPRGGRRQGAAYEVVDDCRHDLAAWTDWLRQRGLPRVGLVGHSLGAVKCLYALAHEPALAPACILALSPPRLSYSWFCAGLQGQEFLKDFARAEELVRSGRPAELLDVKLPLPLVITAGGYVEKYGPDERYDFVRFAGSVPCPTLITFGGVEIKNNMAFRGVPEALEAVTARNKQVRVQTIPGADHFYTGVRNELIQVVETWMRSALS